MAGSNRKFLGNFDGLVSISVVRKNGHIRLVNKHNGCSLYKEWLFILVRVVYYIPIVIK